MHADNSHHLAAAAQRRREDTLARAHKTLHELHEAGQPITVTEIAARAGVSRAWLYAETELRDQIQRLTTAPKESRSPITTNQPSSHASLLARLTLAHERIRELDNENQQLRDQLARLHGQLRATSIISTTSVADTVHDTNNLVKLPKVRTGPR
jgi:hypothetical protein